MFLCSGLLGKVQAPEGLRTVPGVAATTKKDVALASTVNWRGKEIDSAKKERVRIVIKTEREIGTETETDDVPEHPSELHPNVDGAAAGRDGGVTVPAAREETRGRIGKKRGRETGNVVAGKTRNTIRIEGTGRGRERGNGQRTRGARKWTKEDTKTKRRRENTEEKKRRANVRGAKAETGSTERSDLARNALAQAVGPDRKQGMRETGSGNAAIAKSGHTSTVAAKSARTAVNPATVEKT